jgi:hypothetical protein
VRSVGSIGKGTKFCKAKVRQEAVCVKTCYHFAACFASNSLRFQCILNVLARVEAWPI